MSITAGLKEGLPTYRWASRLRKRGVPSHRVQRHPLRTSRLWLIKRKATAFKLLNGHDVPVGYMQYLCECSSSRSQADTVTAPSLRRAKRGFPLKSGRATPWSQLSLTPHMELLEGTLPGFGVPSLALGNFRKNRCFPSTLSHPRCLCSCPREDRGDSDIHKTLLQRSCQPSPCNRSNCCSA